MNGKPFTLVLEPITQQFVDLLAGEPPFQGLLPEEARAILVRAQSRLTGKPCARTEDLVFPVGPTGSVDVRIIRPPDASRALPIIMPFHAGGSILGDKETHNRFMREIAIGVGAAVILVCYGRVPESRFPVAIEQACAATKYAVDEARALNLVGTTGRSASEVWYPSSRATCRPVWRSCGRPSTKPGIADFCRDTCCCSVSTQRRSVDLGNIVLASTRSTRCSHAVSGPKSAGTSRSSGGPGASCLSCTARPTQPKRPNGSFCRQSDSRAAISLARLRRDVGDIVRAGSQLSSVYETFKEGFMT